MKIAAVYSVFNEEEYLDCSIRSVRNHVDQVVVNVNQQPWDRTGSRPQGQFPCDRTEEIVRELARHDPRVVVRTGRWTTEVEHRQAGMAYCLDHGFDYYFLVDGDEVYRPEHLEALLEEIRRHPQVGTFQIKCIIFWRGFAYRIPPQAMTWTPWRVFRIDRRRRFLGLSVPYQTAFIGDNKTNSLGPRYLVPQEWCVFYHFSYARSEEKMRQKLATFSVANQVRNGWLERVWLRWPSQREMRNIHPMVPEEFPQASWVGTDDLPEVMRTHPYFPLDIIR